MKFLTHFSLKNPAAMIIMSVIIAIAGLFSGLQLKKETMPDISIPIIAVMTVYPGASPTDILEDVTKPIENALGNLKGVESVNSTTSENSSAVIIQFSFSADMDEAKKEVDEALNAVTLPEGAMDSQVSRISFNSFPVIQLSVSNDKISNEQLQELVKNTIVKEFEGVDGVAQASLTGENAKSVSITLNPEKLKEYKLTVQSVKQQLEANNISFPVGSVLMEGTQQPIKVSGSIQSLEELKQLQIPIFPDPNEQMKKAFEEIGNGMSALGEAVGGLAQGMSGTTQALNGQNQLLSAIHDTESQLFNAKLALKEAKEVLSNPSATPDELAIATATVGELTQQIAIGESALAQMKSQLSSIQKQLADTSKAKPAPKAQPKKAEEKPEIKLVSLEELADIQVVTEKSTSISRINGVNSATVGIIKSQDSNTVDVSDGIKAKMDKLEKTLPEGTQIDIIFDQADMVKESISAMVKEGMLGAAFACIIILFFLRNIRSTLISVVSIPLSILIALLFLKQLDITLNILTLGALAIAVGRVVDDSIVVIENIYRHLQETEKRTADTIKLATGEVMAAITSSTLTTIAVFLPLAFVSGMIGVLFKPFAFTVVIALLASLFVAVTIVPMLAKFMLLKGTIKKEVQKETKTIRFYRTVLAWSLNHKIITLLISAVLFGGSIFLIPSIGTTFMPESEEKYIDLKVELPAGSDIDATNEKVKEIEEILLKEDNVKLLQTTIGSSGVALDSSSGNNKGTLFIQLKDNTNVEATIKRWEKTLKPLQSDSIHIEMAEMNPESGEGGTNKIEVVVKGTDLETIKIGAKKITEELKKQSSLENVSNNLAESKPEILVDIDQEKAGKLGLSAAQVGSTVKELIGHTKVGTVTFNKETLDLTYGIEMDELSKLEDIKAMEFTSALGDKVELQDFAEVKQIDGAVSILSKDGSQYASVSASIKDKNTGKATADIMKLVETIDVPKGVDVSVGGTIEQMNESFQQLGLAIAVAIGVVYLVMVIAFGEARAPFAILFSLPLALIGGLLGLFITGIPIDMPAMIGFLMLIGIVVTNAIVLIDRVQHQREAGVAIRDALIEAGTVRLRPILMTALATMGALMPLGIGLHSSTILSQSLAIVVICGLATSTLLTLVVVPVVFELLHWKRKKKTS